MPEGDTIHRSAATLRRALVGHRLTRVVAPRLRHRLPPAGVVVTAVEARGKHLLIHLDDGHTVHTHMRMSGAWHVYPAGTAWRRPRSAMRLLLATRGAVAVCFDAPVVEILDRPALRRHPALRRLGPDLAGHPADVAAAVTRMGRLAVAGTPIVTVLLDQRIAAGIGNVIASEACFLAGIDPRTPVQRVDVVARGRLLDHAAAILHANLDRTARTTVPGAPDGSLWVYGRTGRRCRRCATPVRAARVGPGARPTYWCPSCQP